MNMKLQLPNVTELKPRITVVGVGGAGCNAVNNMIATGLTGVEFVVANTDAQALATSSAERRLQLGANLTEGLGAGSKPEIGEAAAEEALDDIRTCVTGSHMVFIAAGMGGGTGTGAAAVIARVAKEAGVLAVGVVTKPFHFEGARRMRVAEAGVAEIKKHVDTLIVIPNQNLFRIANDKTTFAEAFVMADQVLYSGIACIVDLIVKEGLINLDFADVRTVMSGMGTAVMGTGEASGERRATSAAEDAIANPLLDEMSLRGAKGLLVSITGGKQLTLYEVDEAASRIRQEVDSEANIIVGATFDEKLGDRIRVSIVASGMQVAQGQRGHHAHVQGGRSWPHLFGGRDSDSRATGSADPAQLRRPSRSPPPPLPPSAKKGRGPVRASDDMTRALSEAIERAAVAEGQPPKGKGEAWHPAEGVVFEDGPPRLGVGPPAGGPARRERSAEPAATAASQGKRPARRMPEVDDFPPVAQREYRAKTGQQRHGGSAHMPPPEPPAPANRKPSLFQRLTGSGRREEDARPRPRYPEAGGSRASHKPAWSRAPSQSAHREGEAHDDVELPQFFNQERKR